MRIKFGRGGAYGAALDDFGHVACARLLEVVSNRTCHELIDEFICLLKYFNGSGMNSS